MYILTCHDYDHREKKKVTLSPHYSKFTHYQMTDQFTHGRSFSRPAPPLVRYRYRVRVYASITYHVSCTVESFPDTSCVLIMGPYTDSIRTRIHPKPEKKALGARVTHMHTCRERDSSANNKKRA